jgi:SagB-type dehydrogenase family enzyme
MSAHATIAAVVLTVVLGLRGAGDAIMADEQAGAAVQLPEPRREGTISVEQALAQRRSVRDFRATPLPLASVGQLLWAAQGITNPRGDRTAPSAGALHPLEVYLVAGAVTGLEPGVYRYEAGQHQLLPVAAGDVRRDLARAALEQDWVAEAPGILVLAGVYQRSARRYGQRAPRYVHMEVGHAAQNVYLQAVALDLGTVVVGAFQDSQLAHVLKLAAEVQPLGVMPVGHPR